MKKILFNHLSHKAETFPWDALGFTYPKYGPVHSYLASMLAPFANNIEKTLLEGKPTMREMRRLAEVVKRMESVPADKPSIIEDIVKYCEFAESFDGPAVTKAQAVLDGLKKFDPFLFWAEKRLTDLWQQGIISVPDKYLGEDVPADDNYGYGFNRGW